MVLSADPPRADGWTRHPGGRSLTGRKIYSTGAEDLRCPLYRSGDSAPVQ